MSVALEGPGQDVQHAFVPPGLRSRPALVGPLRSFVVGVPLLTAVLLVQALVFGPGFGVSADELALLAQVDALDGGSWTRPHPFPEVDPEQTAYPDHHAAATPTGFAPYAKHPLAPLLLWGARQIAGPFGLRAFLILGHVLAAVAVARVVRRVAPAASMVTFWLVGLASPLALHAHVLWMHSWALALAAVATESVVVLERQLRSAPWGPPSVILAGSLAGLILLRSEGFVFAGAVTGALVLLGIRRRSIALGGLGVCIGAWSVAVWVAESWWVQHLVGSVQYGPSEQPAFVSGRFSAVVLTYLLGGSGPWSALVMLFSVVLFLAMGWLARHGRSARHVMVIGMVAVALHLVVLYAPTSKLVPGMLPALPVLFVPLLLPRGRGERDGRILGYLAVLSLVFVALTAHAGGAGLDWGGRYASLAVPALACLAASRLGGGRADTDARTVAAVATVLLLVTAAAGPAVPRFVSAQTTKVARIEAAIDTRVVSASPAGPTGRPVVVTQDVRLGRVLAARFQDEVTALRAETDEQLGSLLMRLRAAAVTEVVLVGFDDLAVSDIAAGAGWDAAELEALTDGLSARTLVAR